MPHFRPIPLQRPGRPVGGRPLVCAPIVGRGDEEVLTQAERIVAHQPDLIEWRVDHYAAANDVQRVTALLRKLRRHAVDVPLLFTCRSEREGGAPTVLSESEVLDLYEAVGHSGDIDLLDGELSVSALSWDRLLHIKRNAGVQLIGSFHNFHSTPAKSELVAKFAAMQKAGADVAKVAVMPQSLQDVLTLLEATQEAHRTLEVPLISMSMGALGSVSRLFGWVFGSSVTFAVGERASAPGQVPIDDLQTVIRVMRDALSVGSANA